MKDIVLTFLCTCAVVCSAVELNSTSLEGKTMVTHIFEDNITAFYRMLGLLVGRSINRYKCTCTVFFIAEYIALTARTCTHTASLHSQVNVFINDVEHDIDVIRGSSSKEIEPNFDIAAVKVVTMQSLCHFLIPRNFKSDEYLVTKSNTHLKMVGYSSSGGLGTIGFSTINSEKIPRRRPYETYIMKRQKDFEESYFGIDDIGSPLVDKNYFVLGITMSEERDNETYITRLSDHARFIKWALKRLNVPEKLVGLNSTSSLEGKKMQTHIQEGKFIAYYKMLGLLRSETIGEGEHICTVFFISEYVSLTTRTCSCTVRSYSNSRIVVNEKTYNIDVVQESSDQEVESNFDIAAIKVLSNNAFCHFLLPQNLNADEYHPKKDSLTMLGFGVEDGLAKIGFSAYDSKKLPRRRPFKTYRIKRAKSFEDSSFENDNIGSPLINRNYFPIAISMSTEDNEKTYITSLGDHAEFIEWVLKNLNVANPLASHPPVYEYPSY